jgi:hypothetical protein
VLIVTNREEGIRSNDEEDIAFERCRPCHMAYARVKFKLKGSNG